MGLDQGLVLLPLRQLARAFRLATIAVVAGAVIAYVGIVPPYAAYSFLTPIRVQAVYPPDAVGLPYENLQIAAPDPLAAWFIPGSSRATIVLLHGLNGERSSVLEVAKVLHAAGYSLLLPDLPGHGASGGAITTYGYREAVDITAAVRYLQGRPDVDPQRIGLMGWSLGAVTALLTAERVPEVRGVVADSSFVTLSEQLDHQGDYLDLLKPVYPLIRLYGAWFAGVDPASVRPRRAIAALSPRPVLLIHGQDDLSMPVAGAYTLYAAAGEPKDLWVVPGAVHTAARAVAPAEYDRRTIAFFRKAMPPD